MNELEAARLIAMRYIDDNPVVPLDFRPFYDGGVRRGKDYRYEANMDLLFPEAVVGDSAEAECVYTAQRDEVIGMTVILLGPTELLLNGETIFKSNIFTERNNHIDNRIDLKMRQGENLLHFNFKKSALGFGAVFGTWLGKWDYILTRPDLPGVEGCVYRLNGGSWLPELIPAAPKLGPGETALFAAVTDKETKLISGCEFPPEDGAKNLFGIDSFGPWLGLWPVSPGAEPDFLKPIQNTYWRFKYDRLWLRPYYGKGNFGRWSYPLGVTLYGLIRAGELLGDEKIGDYVLAHVRRCAETFSYALWDRDNHGGAASLHNLLCGIDSLDDCGSFGALLEEAKLSLGAEGTEEICDYISDYIECRQPRMENGAFCRKNQLHSFHNDTVWLDDLYMSVPFLCRRYLLTGEEKYLDDAANQFVCYKELLYMEDRKLMSHVFDLRHGLRTGVAWGRGNGWAAFSLSELLAVMPKEHLLRGFAEGFFVELCRGYAARQSQDGRWHQVLDDPDSYLETSCTAMFACAFMRGARMGLLTEDYVQRAEKAVRSIVDNCVDREGNVYGVCRGSEFAFSGDYYKNELLTVKNDTHGIGIVLLAIYEVMK